MEENFNVDDILEKFDKPTPLSSGGQKVVFTIYHQEFGKCVLKIGCFNSQSSLERIQREVSVLNELDSNYFPRTFHFEVVDLNRFYIIEELLNGATLDQHFSEYSSENKASSLIYEIVLALDLLWERRIVHRDIKPKNIIITEMGPRIIDLGIARLLDATSLTNSFAPFGPCTPDYASPEQLENRKKDIDHRSDQFNLGIILAQLLLEGLHPFDPSIVGGDSIPINIISSIWAEDLLRDRVSLPMIIILRRLLGREPYQRYRLVEELETQLQSIGKS